MRIGIIAAVGGLVAAAAVAVVAVVRADRQAYADLDTFLSQEAAEALALVTRNGRFESLVDVNSATGPSQQVALFRLDGAMIDSTPVPPPRPDVSRAGSRFEVLEASDGSGPARVLVVPFNAAGDPRVLVVASPLAFVRQQVGRAVVTMIPLVLLAVVLVAVAGYVLTGLALRPVEELRASAEALALSPGGRRLAVPQTRDELSALATTLNRALDETERVTASQRQFVAEASHELRSPVARLRAVVDFANRPTRTEAELRLALEAIDTDVGELGGLADGLLDMLANQSGSAAALEPTPLAELLIEVGAALVAHPSLDLVVEPETSSIVILCNGRQLAGAIRNLVDNGYAHGRPPVRLSIDLVEDRLRFRVEDHGPGIPDDMALRLREPFVRGPGGQGRAGLGLAIASRVIEMHGGSLEIGSLDPGCRAEWSMPIIAG
jgi:signal transduction histidine kinase